MAEQNKFTIKLDKFYQGYAPVYFENSLTEFGNLGQASAMTNINLLDPNHFTQGNSFTALTNGTQAGAIGELVKYILETPIESDVSFALSNTKLHKISSSAVTNSGGVFPHTITGATRAESLAYFQGSVYYFYQDNVGKYTSPSTFDDDWGSTIPTGATTLQNAPHPNTVKETLMVFGNGRYFGVYDGITNVFDADKLDFGSNSQVVDVVAHQGYFWIAVNSSNIGGSNRATGRVYMYDGAAIQTLLEDETAAGIQRIGFLSVVDGVIYVSYQDLSSNCYKIGYISGNRITEIGSYSGVYLPLHYQKTLYKSTLIYTDSVNIFSTGALSKELPVQTSQIMSAPYANIGAIGSPFGTVMAGSYAGSNYSLSKLSSTTYTTTSDWTSITIPLSQYQYLAYIDKVIIYTNPLGSGAACTITLYYNQSVSNSGAKTIDTDGKTRHVISIGKSNVEDLKIKIDFSTGSTTNPVKIRRIEILGNYSENL